MLEGKHANIGNTAGMLRDIHLLSDDPKLAEEITKLFMAESDDCDYKSTGLCTFPRLPELADINDDTPACMAGRCPHGDIADKEMDCAVSEEFGWDPDVFAEHEHGKGNHIHIGYTGWRKYWNMFKCWLLRR